MTTAMHYPTNYGYVPQTLSGDGDPVDVLVITPWALMPGVVVPCRPIGILLMEDEAGVDGKVLAVPTDKVLPMYSHWKRIADVNRMRLAAITHFFEHYKDLEHGKWVKCWDGKTSMRPRRRFGMEFPARRTACGGQHEIGSVGRPRCRQRHAGRLRL